MKNLMTTGSKVIGATVLAFSAASASATCMNGNQPVACPPPVYNPVPSPTTPTTGTVNNGGNGGNGGQGGQGGNGGQGGTGIGQGGAGGSASAGAAAAAAAAANSNSSASASNTANLTSNSTLNSTVKNNVTVAPVVTATGGAATIASGAVQTTNNANGGTGGTATIAEGAVKTTNTNTNTNTANGGAGGTGGTATSASTSAGGAATVESGALQSSNTASNSGNNTNVNVVNNEVKQKYATPIVAPNLVGGINGCAATSSISLGLSAVGVGGATFGVTTGTKMIEGCTEAENTKAVVANGIISDDPAKVVIGYRAAGRQDDLNYLGTPAGQSDMALFGRRPVAVAAYAPAAAPAPITVVLNGAAAPAPTQPTLPPCVIPGRKAAWQVLNGATVCAPIKN